jgi:hypothetical protein
VTRSKIYNRSKGVLFLLTVLSTTTEVYMRRVIAVSILAAFFTSNVVAEGAPTQDTPNLNLKLHKDMIAQTPYQDPHSVKKPHARSTKKHHAKKVEADGTEPIVIKDFNEDTSLHAGESDRGHGVTLETKF